MKEQFNSIYFVPSGKKLQTGKQRNYNKTLVTGHQMLEKKQGWLE